MDITTCSKVFILMKAFQICINCGHAIETKRFHEHFPKCYDVYYYAEYEKDVEHEIFLRNIDFSRDWT